MSKTYKDNAVRRMKAEADAAGFREVWEGNTGLVDDDWDDSVVYQRRRRWVC